MKNVRSYCGFLLAAVPFVAGCEGPKTSAPSERPGARPGRVKVEHVLISFQGAGTAAVRSKKEAEVMATQIYARARNGENFKDLMRVSDDGGGGIYVMCADLKDASPPQVYARSRMVPAFGDLAFSLNVGEVGMCSYDSVRSPFGWHIVKRLE